MDPIKKALRRLTVRERRRVEEILNRLRVGRRAGNDVKKLKGRNDVFRVRKGDLRIIYRINDAGELFVLAIERRSERTYRGL
ncbi:MAG: type II toxin-antitoxin system RelE/ParE family toxin [bacterium]|nr:type II toxin-antitoxin system RelE/ParE family toxin [bacterium]